MNKKKVNNNRKKRRKNSNISDITRRNPQLLIIVAFFTGILLIVASYAWLSASLNVKVKFLNLSVSSDHGLFISLDGIDFSDTVEISLDTVINDLRNRYPSHTNQWSGGLWPVSSNGIKDPNRDKFDVYKGEVSRRKDKSKKRYLNTVLMKENEYSSANVFIAFDLFLKNVSGSPKSDNLYLENASVDFDEGMIEDDKEPMAGIMNSMRFGFLKMSSVSSKSNVSTIQNIGCNNNCQMVIFEPNSKSHSTLSIESIFDSFGVNIIDGQYYPSYGIIAEGTRLEHMNGHEGTGIPLDTTHFALQNTIVDEDLEKPIFQIPNGITKVRVYIWIEGQDVDSLETNSRGAAIYITIDLVKDLAGYE
ncbi:MAG: hypothetical protein PHH04_08735 [Thomasclavelia sp.]|nr:hypothetical protein [Thomasclavelia sp.]